MTEPNKPDETQPQAAQEAPAEQQPAPAAAQAPDEPKKPLPPALQEERLDRLRRKQAAMAPLKHLKQDPTLFSGRALDDELERELAEAMGGMSADQMMDEMVASRGRQPQRQSIEGQPKRKKGKVVSVHGPDVFVDLPGSRGQGVLPATQFPEGRPKVGTEVEVEIDGYDAENGLLLLTRKGAALDADWSTVAPGLIVEARVTETNKGGLAVDVNGIRGFMPISQIDLYRVENAEQYVNQKLRCMVIEVKPSEKNLVVSRRALLEQEREEQREKLWQELAEGQVREGFVRKVEPFGAFVDLGGVDGLLHVSEMSWVRVKDPKEVVQPGQRIKVVILKIDREHRKIGLGLKQLQASPWDDVHEKYPVGRIVTGKVTRLAEFGAFVELEPAIEGLIHISELADRRVYRAADVVQIGQEVQVQVLETDRDRRRISLSLKAAQKAHAPAEEQEPETQRAAEPAKPPRPRPTPLRGGIGNKILLPGGSQEQ